MRFIAPENPPTGEYGVLRRPAGSAHDATIADLYAWPGAVVPYEHIHPAMTETFTVVRDRLMLKLDGREQLSQVASDASFDTSWPVIKLNEGPPRTIRACRSSG